MNTALDIIEALEQDGIRKIVLGSGHGGNTDALRAALRAHAHRRRPGQGAFVCLASPSSPPPGLIDHPSDHGGESEVSRMMHVRGDLVRSEKLGVFPRGTLAGKALADADVYFVRPWHLHVPASAGGDVRTSSAEKGRKLIEHGAERLARLLADLPVAKFTEMFPFEPSGG